MNSLTAAYQSVINAYQLKTIDIDIEGAALDNFAAEQRRARGGRRPGANGAHGASPAQCLADASG